jgi:hypothetical protein
MGRPARVGPCTLPLHSVPLVQNPLRGSSLWKCQMRNRAFVPWRDLAKLPTVAIALQRGETMELLHLEPDNYGVNTTGIYIIGARPISGPCPFPPADYERG